MYLKLVRNIYEAAPYWRNIYEAAPYWSTPRRCRTYTLLSGFRSKAGTGKLFKAAPLLSIPLLMTYHIQCRPTDLQHATPPMPRVRPLYTPTDGRTPRARRRPPSGSTPGVAHEGVDTLTMFGLESSRGKKRDVNPFEAREGKRDH